MKANGLTPYRGLVLEALRASNNHPTAAEIYRKVRRRRPGVAYATIYNALDWLTRQGLVAELQFGGEAARYDPIVTRHDHLVCTRCGSLADDQVPLKKHIWSRAGRKHGFLVQDYRLELFGLCPRCAGSGLLG